MVQLCCIRRVNRTQVELESNHLELTGVRTETTENNGKRDFFQQALDNYKKTLSRAEYIKIFTSRSLTREGLLSEARFLKSEYEASVPVLYNSICSVFDKILGFSSVLDVYSSTVSNPGCVIWGSVKFILEVTSRSNRRIEAAVNLLMRVTDQMPLIDALHNLFPDNEILGGSIVGVYTEIIGLCSDCILLFRRRWYSNLATTEISDKTALRADRVRDWITQTNWAGLIAYYTEGRSRREDEDNLTLSEKYIATEDFVKEIDSRFTLAMDSKRQGKFAIHGTGGAGKTSLAAYFAHLHKKKYTLILWLHAKSKATLDSDVADATRNLGLTSGSDTTTRCLEAIKDYLRNSSDVRWLVIFDDVDDFALLRKYWPTADHGSVLVTSRDPAAADFCEAGRLLERLKDDQALQLLSSYVSGKLLGEDTDRISDFAIKRMGGLPLAIAYSGRYMFEHRCSLEAYLSMYDRPEDVSRLHAYIPRAEPDSYEHSIATCWRISKEKLQEDHAELALFLLDILMFIDNVSIPEAIFAITCEIPDSFPNLRHLSRKVEFNEACRNLTRHSLLSKDEEKQTYSIHPMIHSAIYESMSASEKQVAFDNATFVLYSQFPGRAKSGDNLQSRWKICNTYYPHVLQQVERAKESKLHGSEWFARLTMHAARYAFEIGQFNQSKSLLETTRISCEQVTGADVGLVLAEALHFQAWMYCKMVSLAPAQTAQEAVDMTQRALDLRLERLDKMDPMVGASYGNLALLTISTGEFETSLKWSALCLEVRMQNEAEETENISCTYLYYGWCYAKMGDFVQAEKSFTQALRVMQDRFGEDSRLKPQTIWVTFGQGDLYHAMGREEEAYDKHIEAYNIGEKLYGRLSPRVFTSLYKKAWYTARRGDLPEAIKLAESLLSEMEKGFYEGHIARTQYFLSTLLRQAGNEERSASLRSSAISIGKFLNGTSWEPTNGQEDFDNLVFFHDR